MDIYNNCGQFNLYAGKAGPCSGEVHRVFIQWEKASGYNVDRFNPSDGGLVCDGHMESFRALGNREEFRYAIVSDEIVGSIGAGEIETGGPKEQEKLI